MVRVLHGARPAAVLQTAVFAPQAGKVGHMNSDMVFHAAPMPQSCPKPRALATPFRMPHDLLAGGLAAAFLFIQGVKLLVMSC